MAPHDAPPKARIGINGFGRIGRVALRQSLRRRDVEVRAINHTCESAEDVMYLIRYDTTHGALGAGAGAGGADLEYVSEDAIRIGGREVALVSTRDASRLDWAALGVDYVLECTGRLTSTALAGRHVAASGSGGGALRVVVSAPSPDAPTFVYGVNSARYAAAAAGTLPRVVSAASCTTNCVAPVLKVLHDALDITQAFFTTVHAATQSQHILDGYSRKSLRLGRSVFNNIIPTTTGASKAVAAVIPELAGKIQGMSIRVPTSDVSMVDLTVATRVPSSIAEVLALLQQASQGSMAGVLSVSDQELVSSDLLGSPFSCIVDSKACVELNPNFFKIIAWYDNEWGYSSRLLDLVSMMNKLEPRSI